MPAHIALDPCLTPPFVGQPPTPNAYFQYLTSRWGAAAERIPEPGDTVLVADGLDTPLPSGYACSIWAWRAGRSRWLVTSPRYAEAARAAWETPGDPTTGWPVGLYALIGPDQDSGGGSEDGWDLLVWPQTLRPVANPLLAKRVRRLAPRDAAALPADLCARADRAGAIKRREFWVIFDAAGRRILSWLWTGAYTERLRGLGIETAKAHRGRGLAGAVLSVATRDLLAEGLLPLYNVNTRNAASQAVALSVGYRPVARNFRLKERV